MTPNVQHIDMIAVGHYPRVRRPSNALLSTWRPLSPPVWIVVRADT
jgi:hypothetical protein